MSGNIWSKRLFKNYQCLLLRGTLKVDERALKALFIVVLRLILLLKQLCLVITFKLPTMIK